MRIVGIKALKDKLSAAATSPPGRPLLRTPENERASLAELLAVLDRDRSDRVTFEGLT